MIINNLFSLIDFYIKKKISSYSDNKIETLLRANIHSVERRYIERTINFQKTIYSKLFYFEAKKRKLLSNDEDNWCRKILFGEEIQENNKIIFKNDKGNLFEDILINRRSVRDWENIKITEKKFKKLIDAARWAPSSCNRQPWQFILIQNQENIKFLANIKKQKFIENAPSCILVLINLEIYNKIEKYYFAYLDAGVAIQNLLLMAENINLGACLVNLAPTNNFEEQKEKIRNKFKIPLNFEPIAMIFVGKNNKKPNPPGRKNISSIISFDSFGKKNEKD